MEPERNIEKLLRSFAKHRRAQTGDPAKGDPFALHPATRRLLQSEVARQAPPLASRPAATGGFWTRFILAGALGAAGLFILLVQFLPAFHTAKAAKKVPGVMANLAQLGMAAHLAADDNAGKLPATLDDLTNVMGNARLLRDPQTGQPFTYVGGGEALASLPAGAVLAYGEERPDTRRPVLFADGSVAMRSRDEFATLTNRTAEPNTVVAAAMPVPAAIPTLAMADSVPPEQPATKSLKADKNLSDQSTSEQDRVTPGTLTLASRRLAANDGFAVQTHSAGEANLTTNQMTQTFVVLKPAAPPTFANSNSGQFYRNVLPANRPNPMLVRFQWQQNGNVIRIVDADGSVYTGAFLDSSQAGQNRQDIPAQNLNGAQMNAAQNSPVTGLIPQGFSFRVSGLNQTLHQNIVFNGSLVANDLSQATEGMVSGNISSSANNSTVAGTGNAQQNGNGAVGGVVFGSVPPGNNSFGSGGGSTFGSRNQNNNAASGNAANNNSLNSNVANNNGQSQAAALNVRIVGTVLLEDNSEFDIDAMPIAP